MTRGRGSALMLLACLVGMPATASAQTLTIVPGGDGVRIRAPGWSFLGAEPLARLKEGRTVRVELAVAVLAAPGRAPETTLRQMFSVSYDLWEERFAIAITRPRVANVSHLTASAAEAWCVERLAVPATAIGSLADRFWIRVESHILDGDGSADTGGDSGLTLQRLIDVLSRRRKSEPASRAIEGGPFRLPR